MSHGATYLPSLTGLRFYAALLVVLYHLNTHAGHLPVVSELTRFGRTGVTFFFVLSGFVLTWSYWGKTTPLRVFYWRRFARIWPLHMFATFVSGAAYGLVNHRLEAFLTWDNLWPSILLIHAWFPEFSVYWGWSGASWSLSNEAFFYAIFPVLAVVFAARSSRWLLMVPVAMTCLSLALWVLIPADGIGPYLRPTLLSFFPLSRVVQFIAGVALACAIRKGWRSPFSLSAAVSIVLGWHVLLFVWSEGTTPGTFWYPSIASQLFSLLPFAILIATVATRDIRGVESHLARPSLVLLGQASFAWYLLHTPTILIIVYVLDSEPDHLWERLALWLTAVIISQLVAIAVYLRFEHPLERWMRKWVKSDSHSPSFRPAG